MTTQYTILKGLPAGLTFTSAKLFTLVAPDTVVTGNTFGFSNRTNATSQYVVSIVRATALPAGDYTLIAYIGTQPKAELHCTFTGTDGETASETPEPILVDIKEKTDLIGTGVTDLLAAAVLSTGTIIGFPETITIGDSYTTTNGHSIVIPIVDTDGEPISSSGSLNFADATVSFTIRRAKETSSSRVITGTAAFVPGAEPYVRIQLSSSETSKGLVAYQYAGVLKFTWTDPSTEVISFETSPIQFDN